MVELFGLVRLKKDKSVLGGFWTCQALLLGAVGMEDEGGVH